MSDFATVTVTGEGSIDLFVVHPANGHSEYLRRIDGARSTIRFKGINCRSTLDADEQAERLADEYLPLILESSEIAPVNIAGYCAGVPIAHELALRLQERQVRIGFFGILDYSPPPQLSLDVDELEAMKWEQHRALMQALDCDEREGRDFLELTDAIPKGTRLEDLASHFRRWAILTRLALGYSPRRLLSADCVMFRSLDSNGSDPELPDWIDAISQRQRNILGQPGGLYKTSAFSHALVEELQRSTEGIVR